VLLNAASEPADTVRTMETSAQTVRRSNSGRFFRAIRW